MINSMNLEGRLPAFEGKYTPANGDKKSRMNWAMNVALSSKNEAGYYDEALVNFTAWGYAADQLQQVNLMDKTAKKEFTNLVVTARFNAGYKDKDGVIKNSASLDVSEVKFLNRLPKADQGAQAGGQGAYTPAQAGPGAGVAQAGPGAGRPGVPGMGAPMGAPGMGAPGVGGGARPRF